jgi:hypothetical protein
MRFCDALFVDLFIFNPYLQNIAFGENVSKAVSKLKSRKRSLFRLLR